MSLVSFFFQKQPRGNIGGITIDATINDDVSYSSAISKVPIEDGSFISDHITIEPYSVSINGIITDNPLFLPGTTDNSNFLTFDNSRVKNAYEQLLDLFIKKVPFDVVTGLDIYTNVFFNSFDISRDADTGKALAFSAKFQQVRFASASTVIIPREKIIPGKKDSAQSDTKKGAQQAADAAAKREQMSLLYSAFGPALAKGLGL